MDQGIGNLIKIFGKMWVLEGGGKVLTSIPVPEKPENSITDHKAGDRPNFVTTLRLHENAVKGIIYVNDQFFFGM
jgi:hypothetical protein